MFTSIVPSPSSAVNSEQNSSKFQFKKDLISSKSNPLPGQQQNNRNPATKSGTFHGRKFIEKDNTSAVAVIAAPTTTTTPHHHNKSITSNNSQQENSSRIRSKKVNSSLNDLDKLLDNDAVALLNMRKDLSLAQENEVEKARKNLLIIQKEYDTIQINNQHKEYELLKLYDDKKVLITLLENQQENRNFYENKINFLQDEIQHVDENIHAEQRTKLMMIYIIKRLENEILECKSKSHHWSQQLQQIKAELNGIDSTLRLSKHELTNDEKQVEILSKTIKGRTEQRIQKMNELQSLVLEGEASVMKIKNTLHVPIDGSPRKMDESLSPERFNKTDLQKGQDDSGNSPQNPEYELTKEQIREIIERYNTRHPLIEKLTSIQSDLNSQIKDQKSKKSNFEDLLEKSNQKLQLLASNRQIYQEVDMKDAALASARKEGDDCRERDQRLRKGIEGLRRSIPRFLQKVNKELIPDGGKPVTIDQLPDVVHKLDDEISKLIKLIGERMLKDATAEDISNMSTSVQEYNNIQTAETTSETSRLHKLPGYHRLEKQLFFNLMSAVPDTSDKNIRVQPSKVTESNDVDNRGGINSQDGGDTLNKRNGPSYLLSNTTGNDYIDRSTVKSISKLVVTQKEKSLQMNSTHGNGSSSTRYGKRNNTNIRTR